MLDFFEDTELVARKHVALRVPPPTPETGWRPPTDFPDLHAAIALGFDLEVKEYDFSHGSGWSRGKSHIVGIAITAFASDNSRLRRYYPIAHEVEPEYNLDRRNVIGYTRAQLSRGLPLCGANLLYDIGTAAAEGIEVTGELHDCQFAEALLHESGEVNLDYLGLKYCGVGKDTNQMYAWIETAYGKQDGDPRGQIWRTSPRLAGPYAEQDSELPFDIVNKQIPRLNAENLWELYRIECDLIPLWVAMRFAGVRIDLDKAHDAYGAFTSRIVELQAQIKMHTGVELEPTTPNRQLQQIFDKLGISYPFTAPSKNFPNGQASFVKEWMKAQTHPVAAQVNEVKELEKTRSTFIQSYLIENTVNGVLHAEFNPLRAEKEGTGIGTRSGRLSSSNPNLQNIPVRTELGKIVREAFVPDIGHACISEIDVSQYEYRLLAHFAIGPGSDELRAAYTNDPRTDYHQNMIDTITRVTGKTLDRKPVKTINFSLMNAMGLQELARRLGMLDGRGKPTAACVELFKTYHEGAPYINATSAAFMAEAQRLGYITTILNRRRRFEEFEPAEKDWDNPATPLPYHLALLTYGHDIVRSRVHIALNTRLQGSNADGIKRALWLCLRSGVFRVTGWPRWTVHDSLGFSVIEESPQQREAYDFVQQCMCTALPLRVPIRTDESRGPNWGKLTELKVPA